jgi:uncharacterized membrane protein YdbT with pleckstrin-like domain
MICPMAVPRATHEEPLPPGLRLREDEQLIMALRPSPRWIVLVNQIVTLGLYTFWWRRTGFVLTDQRIIYRRGLLNTIERSLPLRFVQDATVLTSWTGIAAVMVSTAGGAESFEQLSPLTKAEARDLKDALLEAAGRTWVTNPPARSEKATS